MRFLLATTIFALALKAYSFAPLAQKAKNSKTKSHVFNGTTFFQVDNPIGEESGWHLKDPKADQIQGISLTKAHEEFLKSAQLEQVIVAVIDSGIDVNHEDLKNNIWINEKEIPNNNVDDDGNGYIDDVMGWNFIGKANVFAKFENNEDGSLKLIPLKDEFHTHHDSYEIAREVTRLGKLKENFQENEIAFPEELEKLLKEYKDEVESERASAEKDISFLKQEKEKFLAAENKIKEVTGIEEVTLEALENMRRRRIRKEIRTLLDYYEMYDEPLKEFEEGIKYYQVYLDYYYNTELKSFDRKDRFYGNNDVIGPDSFHGTHVAGIIAAQKNNGLGVKGIANNVKIMPLKVVPDGDERDLDVANAIYYAVDNGAKIINMSFAKYQSPKKGLVHEAIKYAQDKDVILIHAAGNESSDNDKKTIYPTAFTKQGEVLENWIEVAASNKSRTNLIASFTNFGQNKVDLFAPGVQILSTAPDNKYAKSSGTSMAAPVVSGIAAILLGFKPELKPQELKNLILGTGERFPFHYVFHRPVGKVFFSALSRSGVVANVYGGLLLLQSIAPDPQTVFPTIPFVFASR